MRAAARERMISIMESFCKIARWDSLLNRVRLYYRQRAHILQQSKVVWAAACTALCSVIKQTCAALRRQGTTPSWLPQWTFGIRLARPGEVVRKLPEKTIRPIRG